MAGPEIYSIEVATTKMCPYLKRNCLTLQCMAWIEMVDGDVPEQPIGYCNLINRETGHDD